jgi:hypothetical protein
MGLDMYAYAAVKQGQYGEFYQGAEYIDGEAVNPNVTAPRELAYWRKHPNLHGWMEQLWRNKRYTIHPTDASESVDPDSDIFNGIELELTREDLDELEQAVMDGTLPQTSGFFFGDDSAEFYRDNDLEFIKTARYELFMGMRVFYNSSW